MWVYKQALILNCNHHLIFLSIIYILHITLQLLTRLYITVVSEIFWSFFQPLFIPLPTTINPPNFPISVPFFFYKFNGTEIGWEEVTGDGKGIGV